MRLVTLLLRLMELGKWLLGILTDGMMQHAKKKRSLAAQYSNTNVLNANVVEGVKSRSEAFLRKIEELKGSVDVYVSSISNSKRGEK